ncbi:endogenous retrovirus group K member 7 Gag polyprotein-like [Sorex fumeus]|uniref:endogenous retrovirus group K member 7 Gag polyprotein-like n=1 Tax=Sorex fumeus TaxID=62283 RepID=UPI0024AC896D|nr:endogenous retrovirus group K member 7 Gag polyprotein-like [Sorex fumeus]
MGLQMSKEDKLFAAVIRRMLSEKGLKVTSSALSEFLNLVKKLCPWFPEDSSLTLTEWRKVGKALHKYGKEEGEDKLPLCTYALWLQIKELLAQTSDLEGLEEETASAAYASVAVENPSAGSEQVLPTAPPLSEGEEKDWDVADEMAKRDFEDDFRDHQLPPMRAFPVGRAKKPIPKPRLCPPPVGFQGAMAEARRLGDTSFAFPIAEAFGDDPPSWEPLPLKTLQELRSAVQSSGVSAPYTLQIVDMIASNWMTPYDWHQTAKATLSPGDYVLWRTDYEDRCKDTIGEMIKKRGTKPTMDMLLGTGEYAANSAQVKLPRDVLEAVTQNAILAWRKLPPPGAKGTTLSGIVQGTEETYQNFVSRLEEAVHRMLPPSEGTDMLIKQLAWENANVLCKDLLRPIRKTGTLQDFIKACLDASPAVVQGIAYAAAMKGQKFSTYVKKGLNGNGEPNSGPRCYSCGKLGHVQRNCSEVKNKGSRPPPGLCPKCKRGRHWKNECRSKFTKDGVPLTEKETKRESKN